MVKMGGRGDSLVFRRAELAMKSRLDLGIWEQGLGGVGDAFQTPAFLVQGLLPPAARVFVTAAVDEVNLPVVCTVNPDFRRALDIVGLFSGLYQLIHISSPLVFKVSSPELFSLLFYSFPPLLSSFLKGEPFPNP